MKNNNLSVHDTEIINNTYENEKINLDFYKRIEYILNT